MDKTRLFEITFQKVSSDAAFLAYYFNQYAILQQTGLSAVMEELHCDPESFYKLALCKAPERSSSDFTARLGNIAGYAGVSLTDLDRVMRTVSEREKAKAAVWLPAFLFRWYRAAMQVSQPPALGRAGLSTFAFIFIIGIITAKEDRRYSEFYNKGFSPYKDSVSRICVADHTQVNHTQVNEAHF